MSDFDFDTPIATRKRGANPASATTFAEPTPTVVEADGSANAQEVVDAKDEKPKYNPDELASIFDEIVFSGEYSEQVAIRGKLRVVFRTRTAEELKEINRIVDGTQAVFATTLDGVRSLLQLQYALVMYQDKDLRSLKAEEKSKFLGRIPGPVVGALLNALAKFDEKIFAACQEGEENF